MGMNENIERVLAELDGFRMCDQMDYDAYSRLHDGISELDDLLKVQELPPVKPEKLEERTTKWLDNMTAEERLKEIAAILDDWDGYRTAKGLGGLINEIWAYALYPVKAQEPRVMTLDEVEKADFVYIEQCGFIVPALRIPHLTLSTSLQFVYSFQGNTAIIDISPRAYNKALRCWTSRPTDEQREATPWN